jgi:hypothetical protein
VLKVLRGPLGCASVSTQVLGKSAGCYKSACNRNDAGAGPQPVLGAVVEGCTGVHPDCVRLVVQSDAGEACDARNITHRKQLAVG